METLRCYGCQIQKSVEDFSPSQRKVGDSKHRYCKPCRFKERQVITKRTSPLTRRKWMISSRYKMTLEDVEDMLNSQNKSCAICLKDISHKYHIDHNYKTGEVRGLLCPGCNTRLSQVEDIGLLESSLRYLGG